MLQWQLHSRTAQLDAIVACNARLLRYPGRCISLSSEDHPSQEAALSRPGSQSLSDTAGSSSEKYLIGGVVPYLQWLTGGPARGRDKVLAGSLWCLLSQTKPCSVSALMVSAFDEGEIFPRAYLTNASARCTVGVTLVSSRP